MRARRNGAAENAGGVPEVRAGRAYSGGAALSHLNGPRWPDQTAEPPPGCADRAADRAAAGSRGDESRPSMLNSPQWLPRRGAPAQGGGETLSVPAADNPWTRLQTELFQIFFA